MISGDEDISVDKVREEYEKADQAIKEYERLVLTSPWAAVNQVRCAGYHLLHAKIADANSPKERCHLRKAQGHCQRACFDAFEGIIYSHLDFIAKFHDICRSRRQIESVYPDYRDDFDAIVALQERLLCFPMVQKMTDDDQREVFEVATKVKTLKVKMLRLLSKVQKLDLVKQDEEMLAAIRQFLVPFLATVAGTFVGLFGFGICLWDKGCVWGTGWGLTSLLVGVGVFYLAIKFFYHWSVNHLLTEEQRLLLKNHAFTLR